MALDEEFKKRFTQWCGFDLESDNIEDAEKEIATRQWDLENEINQQAKNLIKHLKNHD